MFGVLVDKFGKDYAVDLLHKARTHRPYHQFIPFIVSTNRLNLGGFRQLFGLLFAIGINAHALPGGGQMTAMFLRGQ